MSVGGAAVRTVLVIVAVVVLLATAGGSPGLARSGATVAVTSGDCGGPTVPASEPGVLTVDGGPLGAAAAGGVTIDFTFDLQLRFFVQSSGTTLDTVCTAANGSAVTQPSGDFALSLAVPALNCDVKPGVCVEYTGPFAPVALRPAAGPPPGYTTTAGGGVAGHVLSFVYELASVELTPPAPALTVAPNAPTVVTATGLMANGNTTPLAPQFAWTLSGTGWSFVRPPTTGASVTVVGVPGASVGTLEVQATAWSANTTLAPPPANLSLLAQPTAIEEAVVDRTTVDVGDAIEASLQGVGAAGYPYSATFDPGLGNPSVEANCSTAAPYLGTSNVSCFARLVYPAPGEAQPTATLTNGFSSSTWRFPNVTVSALPEVSVAPGAPVGYVGEPVPLEVIANAGTGAAPFAEGCLRVADGAPTCRSTPGPGWTFSPSFGTPGNYSAWAWAIDAEGENGSVPFSILVVPVLSTGPIVSAAPNLTAGTAVLLSATIAGGDLPLRYWWNASDMGGSLLAGVSATDGSTSVAFAPASAGAVTVTLTVVDALGTYAESTRLFEVAAPPAITLAVVDPPPASPVPAGTSFDISWAAFDRSDERVRGFGVAAEANVSVGSGPATVSLNASGYGALPSLGNGTFGIPASAWQDGALNLTVTSATAGTLVISLGGPGLPTTPAPLRATIAPDRDHLRLFDPVVEIGGSRSNATFWHVTDRFGNPAVGAVVVVRSSFGTTTYTALVPAVPAADGGTGVWVNYSAPGSTGGSVVVDDSAGDQLLGPVEIPAVSPPIPVSAATVTIAAAVPIGALGALCSGLVHRRARRRATPVAEEELRRLAEGRSQVLEIVRRAGSADLAAIEAAWTPPPAPAELPDWLASLVADGTLGATLGGDGRARFCLAEGPPPRPHVTVDADAFDRALERRDALLDGAGDEP